MYGNVADAHFEKIATSLALEYLLNIHEAGNIKTCMELVLIICESIKISLIFSISC